MDEHEKPDPLRKLGERLDKARLAQKELESAPAPGPDSEARRALGVGLRLGLELVVAVFVGAGIGWALDGWLGTRPWGMIVFIFLGFGAGVLNVFRAATGMERAVGFAPPAKPERQPPARSDAWDEDED